MGRKPTTGKFKTREELIEKVLYLYHNTDTNMAGVATHCGVSAPTVASIVEAHPKPGPKRLAKAGGSEPQLKPVARRQSPPNLERSEDRGVQKKTKPKLDAPTAGPVQPGIVGHWCMCFQDTDKVKAPYQGQILSATHAYWKLKVGRHTVTVNRGACSSNPYPKRK